MEYMNTTLIVIIVIVLLALLLVKKSLVIISQSETKIVERLGRYHATLQPGINIIIPFFDKAKEIVTLRNGVTMQRCSRVSTSSYRSSTRRRRL